MQNTSGNPLLHFYKIHADTLDHPLHPCVVLLEMATDGSKFVLQVLEQREANKPLGKNRVKEPIRLEYTTIPNSTSMKDTVSYGAATLSRTCQSNGTFYDEKVALNQSTPASSDQLASIGFSTGQQSPVAAASTQAMSSVFQEIETAFAALLEVLEPKLQQSN